MKRIAAICWLEVGLRGGKRKRRRRRRRKKGQHLRRTDDGERWPQLTRRYPPGNAFRLEEGLCPCCSSAQLQHYCCCCCCCYCYFLTLVYYFFLQRWLARVVGHLLFSSSSCLHHHHHHHHHCHPSTTKRLHSCEQNRRGGSGQWQKPAYPPRQMLTPPLCYS